MSSHLRTSNITKQNLYHGDSKKQGIRLRKCYVRENISGKKHCETFFLFLIQAPQQRANKQLVLSDHARQTGDLIPVPEGGYTHPVAPRPRQEGCG